MRWNLANQKNKTPYQKEQSLYIISHHHIDMKIILKNGYYRLYQNLNHNSVNLASCGSAGHSTSFIRIRRYLIYRRLQAKKKGSSISDLHGK
jgi:hypothetical protein